MTEQVPSEVLSTLHRSVAHAIECNRAVMGVAPQTLAALVECAEALQSVTKWLSDRRLTTYSYMESSDFYTDKCEHQEAAQQALAKLEAL